MALVSHEEMFFNALPHPVQPVLMGLNIAPIKLPDGDKWMAYEVPTHTGLFAFFVSDADMDEFLDAQKEGLKLLRGTTLWTPDQSNGSKIINPEELRQEGD